MATSIRVESKGSVATIWIDGPSQRNALGSSSWEALPAAVAEADSHPECRIIVLRGAGSHFGAGADIKEFGDVFASRDATLAYFARMEAAMRGFETASKPTCAAIEGQCVGACVALVLACDFRLGAADSSYAITPAKLGIAYPYEDVRRVRSAIGPSRTRAMMFSGRPISADLALTYSLIDAVLAGDFEAELADFTRSVTACSPWTNSTTKRALGALHNGLTADQADYPGTLADAVAGPHFREGMAAFLDRRAPRFPQ